MFWLWLLLSSCTAQTDVHNRKDFATNMVEMHPTYLAIASKIVRPGTIYRVVCTIFHTERPLHVRASISRDGTEVTSAKHLMKKGESQSLLLKVPPTTISGQYLLRLEGNVNIGLGGSVFSTTKELDFSPRFLTILIQTSRAVYTANQAVRFRIIVLNTDMKPFADNLDINMLNPKGYVMKNYGSVFLNVGVGSFVYQLPLDPNRGWWTVQVVARNQIEEKRIYVEKYYIPRIEVFVQMPHLALDTDEMISGTAYGWYLNNAAVFGNGTLRVYVSTPTPHYKQSESVEVYQETVELFEGSHEFDIKMTDLEHLVNPLPGSIVTAEFSLTDKRLELSTFGFTKTRIIDGSARLRFLGDQPRVFKSGMPFLAYIAVSYSDSAPLPASKLQDSTLHISRIVTRLTGGTHRLLDIEDQIPEGGVYRLEFEVPENTVRMTIQAVYTDNEEVIKAELTAFSYDSVDERSLFVYTSTKQATVGEYVIFHVRGNFYIDHFDYVVSSKGVIVHSGYEEVSPMKHPIKTFTFPVSSEMVPNINLVIYHVTRDGIVVSDSIRVPVNPLVDHKFKFELNNRKDKTGNTLEYCFTTEPGDQIAVSAQDIDTSCMNCGQEISKASVLEMVHTFEENTQLTNKIRWTSRDVNPDTVFYYESPNYGKNDEDTFRMSQLEIFTDALVDANLARCSFDPLLLPCQDRHSCYPAHKACDGHLDCKNGYDEANCARSQDEEIDWINFRIFRTSRFDQYYDIADGDWAWFDFNSNGFDAFHQAVPNRASTWIINAFHTNKDFGLSILNLPFQYIGTKPFLISVEMVSLCRRGEQISVRVELFNFGDVEIFVTVVLADSDDYRFVHVEEDGQVRSYDPRTSAGEHHHLVWVQSGTTLPVFIPIVPIVLGEITVVVEAWTNVGMDRAEIELTVEPEGVTQFLHTSMLVDLKNQPTVLKFLDVNVTETPVVPYERWRKYIFGSSLATFSIVGDVFGPAFPDMPMTAGTALRKPDRTGEMQLFNFAINLYTLHYLRLTNQMTSEVYNDGFDQLNYYYAYVMAYQHELGSFTMFKDQVGSVWLTALVLRTFQQARFPDWENDIYIDPQILLDGLTWILDFQLPNGAFRDTTIYPLDRKISSQPILDARHAVRYRNISLTAQVLLTLGELVDLPGELRIRASSAKLLATQYLERHLPDLTDPYEIAIVAYALTKVNSAEKELAFDILDKMKIEQEDHVYWAKEKVEPVKIIMENQRPFIQPRLPGKYDAVNVETTAYALLVYVVKEGFQQEQIVRWLNSMRSYHGGFISTQDTLVAMHALTEYTFRTRIRDITDMKIQMEISSMPATEYTTKITEENLSLLQTFPMSNIWGFVGLTARGSGFAIAQLEVQYGVDWDFLVIPPPVESFELQVSMSYSGKNSSVIHVKSCQRWILTSEASVSGVAVLEIQNPTGYWIYQEDLNRYVLDGNTRHVKRAKINRHAVVLYFDHLTPSWTCLKFNLNRYYPVANMTQYLKARVYEYYAPEHYNETVVDVFNLYVLSICQVCGSYQCPYCPFFSHSIQWNLSWFLCSICILISVVFHN